MKVKRIAVLWECYGPYHFSRLAALREHAYEQEILGVEVSPHNNVYAWEHRRRIDPLFHSLFDNCAASEVSALQIFLKLRKFLVAMRVDVLFVPSYWPMNSLVAAITAKSLSLKVVFMGDSHYASGSNTGVVIILKRFFIRIYDSAFVAGSLHRSFLRHLGMPPDKIFDGYDSVDNEHFSSVAAATRADPDMHRLRLGLPPKYFLSLGRFVSKKNLEAIIRSYAILVRRNEHFNHALVFVGSGPMQERLAHLARGLDLLVTIAGEEIENSSMFAQNTSTGRILFFPFAQIETVPSYYALATAFVLASTSDEWGLVVNEAMASGCPVIVSRSVGSSLDLVVPCKTGYRFVPENTHELAWCMGMLSRDPVNARHMGLTAQAHIADWSNERFARNAVKAAKAAFGFQVAVLDENTLNAVDSVSPIASVWFLQTCFPDYRAPVFNRLVERLGAQFHLFTGTTYFTPDIKTNPDYLDWHSLVENRFFCRRAFLWQRGAVAAMLEPEVAVIELNPRVLSNWVILAARSLWGAPTLLWGHAWGREDKISVRNVLRLFMMRLASATITYTRTQRDEVAKIFPRFRVFAATNSLIRAHDCAGDSVSPESIDTVVYVGRLNRPKKPDLLLEAFALARLPARVRLCFVGDGVMREVLEQQVSEYGLGSRVQLLGHVHSHEILRSVYARSFCSVSAGYIGLGAIQSFSFGVPLVLADKEPHAPEVEACQEGVNTVYFTAGDAQALATALEKMWAERELWAAKRSELAKWTSQNYSVEAMVEGFVDAISSVVPKDTIKI